MVKFKIQVLRHLIAKIIRRLCLILDKVLNVLKIIILKLKYPGMTIDFKCSIGKNVKIVCSDGGKMVLKNVSVLDGSLIFCDHDARIEIKDSLVGRYNIIVAKKSIIIEEKCMFAEMVVIRDQDHGFYVGQDMAESGYLVDDIYIERNVWLGAKATILKGVTIKSGSIIGSNAVVTKSTEVNSINVGIPAKKLRNY